MSVALLRPLQAALVAVALSGQFVSVASAQVIVAGTMGKPETDLTPEQEQRLLGEYWAVARRYRLEPERAIAEMAAWTRDRIGKAQSIQYQPESSARPDYLEGKAEWKSDTLRVAAMLHSDIGVTAFRNRNLQDFEFHIAIADGWFALADDRHSSPGSLRSRWNVTVARMMLASGDVGLAERHLDRINARIASDLGILLAYGTVKETQAVRMTAEHSGVRLDEPALSRKPRDAAIASAIAIFERAIAIEPGLVEARVRLAHVYGMKGDDAKAEEILTQVLSRQLPSTTKYLASVLLGRLHERKQRLDAAGKSYLEAILAVPDGQSAYVALAHVFHRSGQTAEAATVVDRMLGRAIVSLSADPWWTYPLGLDLSFDPKFAEYRADVRR